jgi:hypothetical protein
MIWFLVRKCSAYTSPDLNLGVFDSESKSIAAKAQYIEYYQTHPDPLHDQCYHEVDLNKDLIITSKEKSSNLLGPIIYMILNTCDGFGQVSQYRVGIFPTLEETVDAGQIIWKDNHAKCQTDANGEHQCQGYVDAMLVSVFILNQLRYNEHSMYFNHKESVEEIKKDFEGELKSELDSVFHRNFRMDKMHQKWVTKSALCTSPEEVEDISHMKVDLPSNWPGLSQLKELQPLMTAVASKIVNLYPIALAQLQKELSVPKHLECTYEYIMAQLC